MITRWHVRASAATLAAEATWRASATLINPPTSPVLQLTDWMVAPLIVAAALIMVAIIMGPWRWPLAKYIGIAGHLLGMALAFIFGANALFQGVFFEQPMQTPGLAFVCAFGHLLMIKQWATYLPPPK